MTDQRTLADVCASLSRASASGKDLCFISKDSMQRICDSMMPRILELGEIPEWQGAVWVEWKNVPGQFEPMLYRYEQRPFFRFSGKEHSFGIDMATKEYGMFWRAWTGPVPDQERLEVPWQ